MSSRPATLGQLRESGWESIPVKEEVRRNAARRIAEGTPLVDGVLGYESTVLPQLENALLAGHDIIFLGERGQVSVGRADLALRPRPPHQPGHLRHQRAA